MKDEGIIYNRSDGVVRITFEAASLTFNHATDFRKRLIGFIQEGVTSFVIDCGQCSHVDSTFMGMLTFIALELRSGTSQLKGLPGRNINKIQLLNAGPTLYQKILDFGVIDLFDIPDQKGNRSSNRTDP